MWLAGEGLGGDRVEGFGFGGESSGLVFGI